MSDLENMTTTELLRAVDRSSPQVRALAERLETILKLNADAFATLDNQVKDALDELQTA